MPAWHCPPLDNSHVILILIISCRQQVCRSVPLEASNRRESHRSCSIGSPSRIERYVLDPERIAKGSTAHVLLLDPIQIDSIGLSSDGNDRTRCWTLRRLALQRRNGTEKATALCRPRRADTKMAPFSGHQCIAIASCLIMLQDQVRAALLYGRAMCCDEPGSR